MKGGQDRLLICFIFYMVCWWGMACWCHQLQLRYMHIYHISIHLLVLIGVCTDASRALQHCLNFVRSRWLLQCTTGWSNCWGGSRMLTSTCYSCLYQAIAQLTFIISKLRECHDCTAPSHVHRACVCAFSQFGWLTISAIVQIVYDCACYIYFYLVYIMDSDTPMSDSCSNG